MKREDLLQEMKESVGTKDPLIYFEKLTDVFGLLFDQIEKLESRLKKLEKHTALAIQWDSKIASDMLAKEVVNLRESNKEFYFPEIEALKAAYAQDKVTQSYVEFCEFWQTTLGWHPFLD